VSHWLRETPTLLTGAAGIAHALLGEAGAHMPGLLAEPSPEDTYVLRAPRSRAPAR
jgi:hypothetical protein